MMMSTFWEVFFKTFLACSIMDDDDDSDGNDFNDVAVNVDKYLFHGQPSQTRPIHIDDLVVHPKSPIPFYM